MTVDRKELVFRVITRLPVPPGQIGVALTVRFEAA